MQKVRVVNDLPPSPPLAPPTPTSHTLVITNQRPKLSGNFYTVITTMNNQPNYSAGLTTEQLATAIHTAPQTLRKHLCQHGHYYGLVPRKMPNRLLLWPSDSVQRLLAQHYSKGD